MIAMAMEDYNRALHQAQLLELSSSLPSSMSSLINACMPNLLIHERDGGVVAVPSEANVVGVERVEG